MEIAFLSSRCRRPLVLVRTITSVGLFIAGVSHAGTPAAAPATEAAFTPITSRSIAVNRTAETPDYVHALSDDIQWLEFGIESRTRYE
jgi:hypothetical protein